MRNIPKIIEIEANKRGCNSINYCGEIDGAQVFGIGVVDRRGDMLPTGLPRFLKLKDTKVEFVDGEAGLELCSRL